MALPQPAFDILRRLAPCRLLSLGYPDLLIRDEFDVPEVPMAKELRKSHRWTGKIYETGAVFRKLGIEATYADVADHTGREVPIDLNEPPPIGDGPTFDVVLDPGTAEHCFNIGQAFINIRNLCRPGGHIIHMNPMNISNHGFYNISPTLYWDFYEHHDDQIVFAAVFDRQGQLAETRREKRVVFGYPAHNLVVVKRSDVATMSRGWPIQKKYRKQVDKLPQIA